MENLENIYSCALGCFDGVHLGHRTLIYSAIKNFFGYTPAVWTFTKPLSNKYIDDVDTRKEICESLGIKKFFSEDFEKVKNMAPEDFIIHLVNDLNVKHIIAGEDFTYGKDRLGNKNTLLETAKKYNCAVTIVPFVFIGDRIPLHEEEKVSSSIIRSFISNGEIDKANLLLSRPFGIKSTVLEGHKIGRTIGFPTVNQIIPKGRVIPKFGVYYTTITIDGKKYPAVSNVGNRPTVNSEISDITCETHIINENMDLYGKEVYTEFFAFGRDEKKFESLTELKEQITKDIECLES